MENLEPKIMKYVPAVKRHMISAAWIDGDGYWIELKDGFNAGRMDVSGCHTIHEETVAELRKQITRIEVDKFSPPDVKIVEELHNGKRFGISGIWSVIYAGETVLECMAYDDVKNLTADDLEKLCREIGGF